MFAPIESTADLPADSILGGTSREVMVAHVTLPNASMERKALLYHMSPNMQTHFTLCLCLTPDHFADLSHTSISDPSNIFFCLVKEIQHDLNLSPGSGIQAGNDLERS